jgi:CubicO group peptidase (beta-lactamase class C family)
MMRLVERGRVSLDDTGTRYLPEFPHGEITLRQLAGHLSGIRHYANDEFINTTHYPNATAALAKFAADPLIAKPGEKYLYSTYGYNVLGAVIEKVTGQRFDEAARVLVLDPAGMSETAFEDSLASASTYDLDKTGPRPAVRVDLSDRLPAGAMVTTARDLARFLIAMTGNRFLAPDTVAAMFTSQSTADGKPTNVGIAWRIAKDAQGRTFVHHAGASTGGRSALALYPAERVAAVIVTNLGFAQFGERDAAEIARLFLDPK